VHLLPAEADFFFPELVQMILAGMHFLIRIMNGIEYTYHGNVECSTFQDSSVLRTDGLGLDSTISTLL
jgi:hypothetical protein